MDRKRRRTLLILLSAVVGGWLFLWLVIAVIVPIIETAECAGISFRAPAQAQGPPAAARERPPIGGQGGIAGRVRSALRGESPAVYCEDFADPFVLRDGDAYYAYSTNTEDYHVPVLSSGGLFGTGKRSEAIPQLPGWSSPGNVWAPSVLARPGGFVMYYSTVAHNPDRQCLSVAVSKEPGGPFVDQSSGPLVCPEQGGAIDPTPFVDDAGRAYLLWKHYDGLHGIVAQELSPDGRALVGEMRLLVEADQGWEGGLVEGPTMVASEGRYYLFYSGNNWDTANYAIGYAVCDTPLGPCAKPPGDAPWLASTEKAEGPGGQEVFADDDGDPWMVLHAWVRGKVGYPHGARNVFVIPLEFVDGMPTAA